MIKRKRRFRRLWYMKHRNLKYYRALLYISMVILVFVLLWIYSCMNLFPRGQKEFEDEIYKKIQIIVNQEFDNKNKEIVQLEKDYNGDIVGVKANNDKLTNLSFSLKQNLVSILVTDENKPYLPMKATIFPPFNYKIHLGGARITDVQTSYNSKFIQDKTNNTHITIYLNVCFKYEYLLGESNWHHDFVIWDGILKGVTQKN